MRLAQGDVPLAAALMGIGDWTFAVSPDGQTLAFARSERAGVSDVYVVPLAGGEARRRTRWNANISRVAWMPHPERRCPPLVLSFAWHHCHP